MAENSLLSLIAKSMSNLSKSDKIADYDHAAYAAAVKTVYAIDLDGKNTKAEIVERESSDGDTFVVVVITDGKHTISGYVDRTLNVEGGDKLDPKTLTAAAYSRAGQTTPSLRISGDVIAD